MQNPALKKILADPTTKYDVLINGLLPGNEIGYYFVHRFGAQLVIYCSLQISVEHMDYALGMPHNTAYVPFGGAFDLYEENMNLWQRTLNTFLTQFFTFLRLVKTQ